MTESIKRIKFISVMFNIPVRNEELPGFRGAVIETTKFSNDLFHNHRDDKVIYRYPLVQYKKIRGKAALFCLEEGTEAIYDFFSNTDWSMRVVDRNEEIRVERLKAGQFNAGVWDSRFFYRMTNWLPLNQENYQKYHQSVYLSEKTAILERVLTGNILTFLEGVGIESEKKVEAAITRIAREKVLYYRGQLMQSYDLHFSANVSLPAYVSLGKGASIGYGVVLPEKIK
jgi:hypothetical protein